MASILSYGSDLLILLGIIGVLLWFDMRGHKDNHEPSIKEAAIQTITYIAISIAFGGYMWLHHGPQAGMEYYAGYALEKALSVDNLFVMQMIFTSFGVSGGLRHKALAWGILGAIILRGVMIFAGVGLVGVFQPLLAVFGVFLLYTGFKMLKGGEEQPIEDSNIYKWAQKYLPVHKGFVGDHLVTKVNGKKLITTLGLVIVVIEATDVLFATDSIPAIMGVTTNPVVILTSNLMAILGLRALYFLLSGIMGMFRYLKPALALVLAFIGAKMVAAELLHVHIGIGVSLAVVLGLIALGIVASLLFPEEKAAESHAD